MTDSERTAGGRTRRTPEEASIDPAAQEMLAAADAMGAETAFSRREGNHIAQDNIRQRLELAYGKGGSLTTEARDGRYEVEVRFPWEGTACDV